MRPIGEKYIITECSLCSARSNIFFVLPLANNFTMLFTDTQTLDGSSFEHESARHDAWTGFAAETAVLMTEEGEPE